MPVAAFEKAFIGMPVSHIWRGYGSALFVEFGELAPPRVRRDGSAGNPQGQVTLMIEWSWRVEKPRSIMGGSWSSERRWPAMFDKLKGASVSAIRFFGALPEIEVSLSNANGLRVVSFMTAKGQPQWGLIFRVEPTGFLRVRRGKLQVEALTPNPAGQRKPSPPTDF